MKIGADYLGDGRCEFTVWAPAHEEVAVQIVSPVQRLLPMQKDEWGYFKVLAENIEPGTLYCYKLGAEADRPDPASHSQPKDVHGPSSVVDHTQMNWNDADWSGIPLEEMIIYELHVGTFTPEGTFEAIIPRLRELHEFGVNAIELMPIGQFPGNRNWGYDGVFPFAPQHSYGGSEGLKKLVDAAHQQGISIILDVIYNHFGPEGNYFSDYAPYFTNHYQTAWGNALNFDGEYSYGVRNYFIENALYWFNNYHIDALRLDASDHLYDIGVKHFLQELAENVDALSKKQGQKFYLTAENDLSDTKIIRPIESGGYGIDAQWNDAFHHCLHSLLTGEESGYYEDYGTCEQMAKAFKQGFVYSGQYSPFRKKFHGSDSSAIPGHQFVVFTQNHDQVGNRALGERLTHLVSFKGLKLAAGVLMLAPNIPLIFMGEEYAEDAPFLYFVSHTDQKLVEVVREGRKKDFAAFHIEGEFIDPFSTETFQQCQLNWDKRQEGKHKVMREFYQHLIQLRRTLPALKQLDKENLEASAVEEDKLLFLRRGSSGDQIFCIMNFNKNKVTCKPSPGGIWRKILDSSDEQWMGSGSTLPEKLIREQEVTIRPQSFALYELETLAT
ncbi:malto-oligosyltrehalose trehalohydrolase [Allocoleopsis franciscana]|uniref:Malto-oligosyltrehalose trehalohydrolase n=1 Tax=Allocoleopsis franciscana PCC 7113 TaxID=1173027 RepID=K9WI26_9CYAN|nr:malto-oligosyltrehalose trehalohydrolase [Allocoleopsis franciscana]AFZ19461.1 maltooligosyl trehalose hydrolase [Allocoleopsis franciscana PCC 7113]